MPTFNYTISSTPNPVFSSPDGSTIDIDVAFEHTGKVRYTAAESDPNYPHSEEIFERAISGEFGEIGAYVPLPSQPDYVAFWDALMGSAVYASIREQSFVSLPINTLATEFIALLGDAKAGRPNQVAIQSSITAILTTGTFTADRLTELKAALAVGNLDALYRLKDANA